MVDADGGPRGRASISLRLPPSLDSLDDAPEAESVLTAHDLDREAEGASSDDPASCEEITGREKAYLIFTSGTTGMPKASVMTHYRWLKGMSGLGSLGVRLNGDDTLYCCCRSITTTR